MGMIPGGQAETQYRQHGRAAGQLLSSDKSCTSCHMRKSTIVERQIRMKKTLTIITLFLLLGWRPAAAQDGTGSSMLNNSAVYVAPGMVELVFSESLYLGPQADWEVHGTLEVWSRNIWIAPTARIHGTGKLIIHNPGDNIYYEGWANGPTRIDGNNGVPIELDMELDNPHNLVLADIADPGFGVENGTGPAAAALHVDKRFVFAVDGGDVLLNGNDLVLGAGAELLGYGTQRMVVTGNATEGHLTKLFANRSAQVFPVGIAEGDYTPATLSPSAATAIHVSVQDYAAAGIELPDPEQGMDRIWHIYADKGVNTTYTLQHNTVTNGSAYVDASAQIVQYAGGSNWIGDVTVLEGEGIHTREDIMVATGSPLDGSWLTKLSVDQDTGPQADDDAATVESGAAVEILVLENDKPGSSPIRAAGTRITQQPQHGTAVVHADGSITYTPATGFAGGDSFVYEIIDENGLTAQATVRITVTPRKLRIPNVFTPNGDGKNDVWELEGAEGFDRIELTVVNRWGNEVYRSRDYRGDWNGGNLNEGTYYYSLVTHKGNVQESYAGWVLIKR